MTALRVLLARLTALWRSDDSAFRDELASHLQLHVDDNITAGMPPAEARRQALRRLGGVEAARRRYHEQRSLPWLEHFIQDGRFAIRQLVREPVFACTAVATLGLGLAGAIVIFGFVDAVLIRPLPYPDPGRLVFVTEANAQLPRANLSYPDFLDWKRLRRSFDGFDVFSGRGYVLGGANGGEMVEAARVSDGLFRTLGVSPALGRDFRPGEDLAGAPATVILSDSAWRIRFGSDPSVIGRTIRLSTEPYIVIGVLPRTFQFAPFVGAELFTTLRPSGSCDLRRSCHGLNGVARLRAGVTPAVALEEMTTVARRLEASSRTRTAARARTWRRSRR
ncbi:MAG: ABC transporter permease [Acidobacteriota bacterium]